MRPGEAELLVHPNVLASDGAPASGGRWLCQWMEAHGPPPAPVVFGWLRQAAAALDFAHRRGHAHGRFGSASVWISDSGHVKIAGLGPANAEVKQADLPALCWLAGELLGAGAETTRTRILMRQASLGRFSSCTTFVEALRRECDPEALDPIPTISRRRISGNDVVRWALLFALSASSVGAALLAIFLASGRSG